MNYNHSGFTLIALLIVIVGFGILAVLAFIRFVDLSIESRVAVRDGAEGCLKATKAVEIAQTKASRPLHRLPPQWPPTEHAADGITLPNGFRIY